MDYINSLNEQKTRDFIHGVMESQFISNHRKMELSSMATEHLNDLLTKEVLK